MSNASNAGTSAHSLGDAVERLRGKWAAITAFGVLLVVLGFAALAFSLVATIVTVTLNGVLFLIAGGAEIGIGMHSREWGRFFLWVVGGLVYIAAGVLCIVNPILASAILTLFLGAGLIAAGVVRALSRDPASSRPSARPRLSRRRRDDLARFDHCEPLAARQRLCPRHAARRRPFVSRRWLGEFRHGIAGARLSEFESARLSALGSSA